MNADPYSPVLKGYLIHLLTHLSVQYRAEVSVLSLLCNLYRDLTCLIK